ncbi:MAG: hypothetical protein ACYCYJ_00310 [Trichloromonadaceae bacterium]
MKPLLLMATLLLLPLTAMADAPALLEQASRTMNDQQPALLNYRTRVETDQVETMLARMTANMPANQPRPQVPQLFKYWDRQRQASLVRAEGGEVFPYMQEMIGRFSSTFAVELFDAFLPLGREADRAALLGQASLHQYRSQSAAGPLTELELRFAAPTDLGDAFYRNRLGLAQQRVVRLLLAIDDQQLLRRLDITQESGPSWSLSLDFKPHGALHLPTGLHLRADQGQRELQVETRFAEQGGFWLPVAQQQSLRQGDKNEQRQVQFGDYQINTTLPEVVLQQMPTP